MVDFYNFLFSWQLFPEKGTYEVGNRPKSGNYKLTARPESPLLHIIINWVTLEDKAFTSDYSVPMDGSNVELTDAETVKLQLESTLLFTVIFSKNEIETLRIRHEITPQGLLRITQTHLHNPDKVLTNTEIYHKQFSVLPYASSAAGAVVRQNEEGLIRHQALSAMEEQTHIQLEQIRQQIELLALQAKEIQKRKELSMIIYSTKLGFAPVIGQTYFLYEKEDDSYLISMIAPQEWGSKKSYFKKFVAAVKLLADHTWKEVRVD
jgi:hypothetical protein